MRRAWKGWGRRIAPHPPGSHLAVLWERNRAAGAVVAAARRDPTGGIVVPTFISRTHPEA